MPKVQGFLAAWVVVTAVAVFIITADIARRRRRGEELGGAWGYVVLCLVLGPLTLPIYFFVTRRGAAGLVIAIVALGFVAFNGYAFNTFFFDAPKRRGVTPEERRCDSGEDPGACLTVASRYLNGTGRVDAEHARRALDQACDHDYPQACANLAGMYASGEHAPKDLDRAEAYYARALAACDHHSDHSDPFFCERMRDPLAGKRPPPPTSKPSEPAEPAEPTPLAPADFCKAVLAPDFYDMTKCTLDELTNLEDSFDARRGRAMAATCERSLQAALGDQRVTLDSKSGEACVHALEGRHAGMDRRASRAAIPACDSYVTGLVAEGQKCRASFECSGALACLVAKGAVEGKCGPPPGVGEECLDSTAHGMWLSLDLGDHPGCSAGGTCHLHRCQTRRKFGGACEDDDECAQGLECHSHKCTASPPGPAGATCSTAHDCKAGLYCAGASERSDGVCAAQKASGDSCIWSYECKGVCKRASEAGSGGCVSVCGSG